MPNLWHQQPEPSQAEAEHVLGMWAAARDRYGDLGRAQRARDGLSSGRESGLGEMED